MLVCLLPICFNNPGAAGLDLGNHAHRSIGGDGKQNPSQGDQVLQQGNRGSAGESVRRPLALSPAPPPPPLKTT